MVFDLNKQLEQMHRLAHSKLRLQLNSSMRRQFLKLWHLPAAIFLPLLLWALHHQLSNWDGLVEPPHPMENDMPPDAEVGQYSKLWLKFGYNAWLAERIPLRRDLPDVRDDRCLENNYPHMQVHRERVAIVVIFRNEQLAMLLRTLHSIRDRSDMALLGELLLIDDHSDADFWQQDISRSAFKAYVQRFIHEESRVFHLEEQVGLIRARRFAVGESTKETLIFLDAHVEVTEGWLEPLLAATADSRDTLAVPQLDRLDEDTLEYVRLVERRGLFDWSLRRREVPLMWQQLKQLPQPFATAVPSTSVFAINAEWFHSLAHLDMELNAPAAASLELSFKVWRIGGRILQVPCSRVGHLQPSDLSYMRRYGNLSLMAAQHFSSLKRLSEIWLTDSKYTSLVYEYQPQIQQAPMGNVTELQRFIKQANFTSFDWYLQHVATDLLHHFPLSPHIDQAHGSLRPAQLPSYCLTADLNTGRITVESCKPLTMAQNWSLSHLNDLRLGGNNCAEVQRTQSVALNACHTFGGRQSWHFNKDYNSLVSNKHCLEFTTALKVLARPCNSRNTRQMWIFEHMNIKSIRENNF